MIVNITRTAIAAVIGVLIGGGASAATLYGTGNVTPDVIFGSGNANGFFTGSRADGVELGLRAKLRYDLSGHPQNIFNYDGNKNYRFDSAQSTAPADRSIFNFEWAIHSNFNGWGLPLDRFEFLIDVDLDPTVKIGKVVSYDPLGLGGTGYYLGEDTTGNGGGIDAVTAYLLGINTSNRNIAQQSVNMGFAPISTPVGSGKYTVSLSAFLFGSLYNKATINVIVDAPAPIPLPAGMPLLAGALAALAVFRRRRG